MRDAGQTLADLHYYVPHDEEDYFIQTGKLPKALAVTVANVDLKGVRVPIRQQDGTYKDASGAVMQRADMVDYFTRLRAAQQAAAEAAAAQQQQAAAADELMEDDDEVEAAAAIPKNLKVTVHKSQPGGIKKKTKLRA